MNDRVLIVEDSASLAEFFAIVAARLGLTSIRAETGRAALAQFAAEPPDLVIMDVGLPDGSGFDVVRAMRAAEPKDQWTPIIYVTGMDEDAALAEGIAAGGDDYLVKPVSAVKLGAKIEAMRRLADMRQALVATRTQLRAANEQLRLMASVNGLTELANRRRFDDELAQQWRSAARAGSPLSLLLLDVNRFKQFNDTYGHQHGDHCLRRLAALLRHEARRSGDLAARFGGEEFAVLLPDANAAGARAVAERLRQQLHKLAMPHAGSDIAPHVTVSIGIATLEPAPTDTEARRLVKLADDALYRAKADGRNRCHAAGDREPSARAHEIHDETERSH